MVMMMVTLMTMIGNSVYKKESTTPIKKLPYQITKRYWTSEHGFYECCSPLTILNNRENESIW